MFFVKSKDGKQEETYEVLRQAVYAAVRFQKDGGASEIRRGDEVVVKVLDTGSVLVNPSIIDEVF